MTLLQLPLVGKVALDTGGLARHWGSHRAKACARRRGCNLLLFFLGRQREPEEVAREVAYLAGPEAGCITNRHQSDIREIDGSLVSDFYLLSVESQDGCGGRRHPAILGDDFLRTYMERGLARRCAVDNDVLSAVREVMGHSGWIASILRDQPSFAAETDASARRAVGDFGNMPKRSVVGILGDEDHAFVIRQEVRNGDLCCHQCLEFGGREAFRNGCREKFGLINYGSDRAAARGERSSRQGIDLDRSTLADWVGRAAFELRPVFDALISDLKRSTKLFMDETRAPVLDPGSRKTKTGYFWALARDDRPWGGGAPPGVAFTYAPGRGGLHAERILQGFTGILQVDGYSGYNRLIAPDRAGPDIRLAYCWAHARRKLVEIARNSSAPIAEDGVKRIGERVEGELRGLSPEARLAGRQGRSAAVVADMRTWLTHHRSRVAGKSPLGEALAYIAKYWDGLCIFLADGRIEIDNNTVERTIRPIALNRKNALFAGHDVGAENWATIASLIETALCRARHNAVYADRRTMPINLLFANVSGTIAVA